MNPSRLGNLVLIMIMVFVVLFVAWLSVFAGERRCQLTYYGLGEEYGNHGIEWNFFGPSDYIKVKVNNQGYTSLYDFYFEIEVNGETRRSASMEYSQRTLRNPLRPGQGAVFDIDLMGEHFEEGAELSKVTVFDGFGCKSVARSLI
jgi:hypothetical protein